MGWFSTKVHSYYASLNTKFADYKYSWTWLLISKNLMLPQCTVLLYCTIERHLSSMAITHSARRQNKSIQRNLLNWKILELKNFLQLLKGAWKWCCNYAQWLPLWLNMSSICSDTLLNHSGSTNICNVSVELNMLRLFVQYFVIYYGT